MLININVDVVNVVVVNVVLCQEEVGRSEWSLQTRPAA
jgi:hypothetical protein